MPLLSKEEELELGRRYKLHTVVKNEIKRMEDNLGSNNVTLAMVAAHFNTTENDLRLIEHNGVNARTLLVQSNARLVLHIAQTYVNRGVMASSLVWAGMRGAQFPRSLCFCGHSSIFSNCFVSPHHVVPTTVQHNRIGPRDGQVRRGERVPIFHVRGVVG